MPSQMQLEDAAKVMQVELDQLTSRGLGEAYKSRLKVCHPDHGGSTEAFIELQGAKQLLLGWLDGRAMVAGEAAALACPDCGGTGYVKRTVGFRTLRHPCPCLKN